MKRGILFILGFSLLAAVLCSGCSYPLMIMNAKSPSDLLQKACQAAEADFLSENLNAWGRLDNQYHTLEELKSIVGEAADALDAQDAQDENVDDGMEAYDVEGVRQVSFETINERGQLVRIMAHSTPFATYIVIDITDNEKEGDMSQVLSSVEDIFQVWRAKPTITRCILGSLEGCLEGEEMKAVQERVFRELKARKVEGLTQDNMVSISGYTPAIQDGVHTGRGKVNLQVALRCSPSEGKTFLWVGTPVITLEY